MDINNDGTTRKALADALVASAKYVMATSPGIYANVADHPLVDAVREAYELAVTRWSVDPNIAINDR